MIKEIETIERFKEDIKKGLVLMDFYADWCGPCKMIAHNIDYIADKYPTELTIYKINVDKHEELVKEYEIKSIPTIFILSNGEVKETFNGYKSSVQIDEIIKKEMQ